MSILDTVEHLLNVDEHIQSMTSFQHLMEASDCFDYLEQLQM